jgi:hypothetical protein
VRTEEPQVIRWLWAFVDRPLGRFDEAAAFWCAATGTKLSERRGEDGVFATFLPQDADPWLKLQGVHDGGGAHLDIEVDDVDAVTHAALEEHGATLVRREGVRLSMLRTPGGQPFCVTRWDGRPRRGGGAADAAADANTQRVAGRVDQLCFDIAPEAFEREAAFWSGFTSWPLEHYASSEFTRLAVPGEMPIHILLQRRQDRGAPSAAHLDLACGTEVARVRTRHEALGARWVADGKHWQVMRDPAGGLYCLTERDPRTGRLSTPTPG